MNTPLVPALGALKAAAFNPHNLGTSTPIRGTKVGLRVGQPRTRTVGTRGWKPSATLPSNRSDRLTSSLARAGGTVWLILGLVLMIAAASSTHASWAPVSSLRQNTATNGPLEIYNATNFGGTRVTFTAGTTTGSGLGFAATSALSMKVAPGYRARLYFNPTNSVYEIVKPEDDADFSDDQVLTNIWKIVVEKVQPQVPIRPDIFICLTGNNQLVSPTNNVQWEYVRKNVDGIWLNASLISWPNIAQLIKNMSTRVAVTEINNSTVGPGNWALGSTNAGWINPLTNTAPYYLERIDSSLTFSNEAVALFKNYGNTDPSGTPMFVDALTKWTTNEWGWLFTNYRTSADTNIQPYQAIYTGWQPQAFGYKDGSTNSPLELFSTNFTNATVAAQVAVAKAAFDNSAGLFLECNPGVMINSETGRKAVMTFLTNCGDRPFFWFMPPHYRANTSYTKSQVQLEEEYFQQVKNAYYIMEAEGKIREHDVYFPVNYGVEVVDPDNTNAKIVIPSIPSLPETNAVGEPARSFTGILYWLLRQGDETLMEIDFNSPIGGTADAQIRTTNARLAAVSPAVTFATTNWAATLVGGTAGTAAWTSSLDGQSIKNNDLHYESNFGAPTRFDFRLGYAAPGTTYKVTNVSVEVANAHTNNVYMGLNYRNGTSTNIIFGPTNTIFSNSTNTYHLNATAYNLTATTNSTSWDRTNGLRVEFYESNGANVDQLVIKRVIVQGTTNAASSTNGVSAVLMDVRFALTQPVVPTILAATYSNIITHAAVTFTNTNRVAFVNGGSAGSGTGTWSYSGGGTAAMNRDLYHESDYGNPTRIVASMGRAASGKSYRITRADVIVSAADTKDIYFGFSCKKSGTITSGPTGVIKANTPGIYALDLRTVGLQATDSSTTWDVADGLRFEFYQPNGADVDMLAIDKVVFYGVVE